MAGVSGHEARLRDEFLTSPAEKRNNIHERFPSLRHFHRRRKRPARCCRHHCRWHGLRVDKGLHMVAVESNPMREMPISEIFD